MQGDAWWGLWRCHAAFWERGVTRMTGFAVRISKIIKLNSWRGQWEIQIIELKL